MLKAALTKAEFDKADDAVKAQYAEMDGTEGVYLLQLEPVTIGKRMFSLEDISGLKTAVAELKQKAEKRQEALAAFEGIDPADAKAALEKVKQYTDIESMKDDKLKAQAKAIEEQLEAKYTKELEKLRADNKLGQAALEKAVNDHSQTFLRSEALRLFATHEVLPEWQDVLLDKVRAVTKIKPDGQGGFKIDVLHADGTPRITNKQNSTDPMTLDELIGVDFKQSNALAVCYKGSQAMGSGAGGSGARAGGGRHTISPADARDASKYRAAKEAAQKAGVQLVIQ
jgi:hypothetical protein